MLLDWLKDPRPARGIHLAADDGSWNFFSYVQLAADTRRIADRLRERGAGRGRVVSLVLDDPYQFVSSFMGTLLSGAVPAPLAPATALRGTDRYVTHLGRVFGTARPSIVLTEADHVDLVARGLKESDCGTTEILQPADLAGPDVRSGELPDVSRPSDELALLQFTSGSTGNPKGVRVTWGSFGANAEAIRRWLRWTDEDSFASWLPLHHDMGLIGGMVMPVVTGTDVWLMRPNQFLRSPLRWLECFGKKGVTLTTSPSFGYAYTARRVTAEQVEGMDFSRWRVAILGAERIDPLGVADFSALLSPHGFSLNTLVGAYGLAETTVAASGVPADRGSRLLRIDSAQLKDGEPVLVAERGTLGSDRVGGNGWLTGCGVAVHGNTVSIIDRHGTELPEGTFGEIRIDGLSLADGYLKAADEVEPFDADGLHTGDAGFVDDGELYVVGRIGESLKVRGTSLYAEDVEADLKELTGKGSQDCAVAFGTTDEAHHVVVFVEGRVSEQWLRAAHDRVVAHTFGALSITVLRGSRGSISRTSSGKPRRRAMWEQLLSPAGGPDWSVESGSLPTESKA
ncbi:AMP-binding protein [Streptomyces sp. NBC_01275]|uniref:AMP-binding protein n=1 Tax=Streptomyces sp. NBC_01275 TaxID=2903807 RepID=UPI002251DE52|nr:AMP-binding protein [Streptomyces sp. NBC_01275]MCX4763969.1 AMP-binding protein [Streptomyces sp. NBC_01275]